MPDATPCNHCGKDSAVLPVDDAAHDRTIYVCFFCDWWGTDANNIAYPLPEKARVKIVWPDDTNVTQLFPETKKAALPPKE